MFSKNIIPFQDEYTKYFRDLNLEWLEEYFCVEPHDAELLNHCKTEIIDRGGYIFFYQKEDQIVGTFALIKINQTVFELGKMAVTPSYQGQGIGQELLQFCKDFASRKHIKKIILYSNKSLENSIYLYKKYDFKEIEMEANKPYARGNIKMELSL